MKSKKAMKPWLDHIKKNFKGDERYLMTQTYYRQQGYKPIYALKGSLSLLLQIPFFIAAYHFLSNCTGLQGTSFLFIKDLGAPDGLIKIGDVSINLLPILMTAINVVSGAIYTRGFPLKDKIQLYGVAAVFLILLYSSPAGLVFYWTLNNLFSLCKNIVMKMLKDPIEKTKERISKKKAEKTPVVNHKLFVIGTIVMTILMGLLIPSAVIVEAPNDFISTSYGPVGMLVNNLSIYAGVFLVWVNIYYWVLDDKVKSKFKVLIWIVAIIAIIDYMFFGTNYGVVTNNFVFQDEPLTSTVEKLINILAIVAATVTVIIVIKKFPKAFEKIGLILGIGVAALFIVNFVSINSNLEEPVTETQTDSDNKWTLSKTENNVVVIMLDKALGEYLPYIFNEKEELQEKYDGFTVYTNTLSYGYATMFGASSIFGGYDYTPSKINERSSETISEKYAESLKAVPTLFATEGFTATVCNAPLESVSVFDDNSLVNGFNIENNLLDKELEQYPKDYETKQLRNECMYSLVKALPLVAHGFVYGNGSYLSTTKSNITYEFIRAYLHIGNLNRITTVDETASEGAYICYTNQIAHLPCILDSDTYDPKQPVDGYDSQSCEKTDANGNTLSFTTTDQIAYYDSNMAGLIKLSEWLDTLRELGVYDNTRIIIASDHGGNAGHIAPTNINEGQATLETESINPILLVKDFNSHGFTISDEFMVNADVAAISASGLIENPTNPFTGNPITMHDSETINNITVSQEFNYEGTDNLLKIEPYEWVNFVGGRVLDSKSYEPVQ